MPRPQARLANSCRGPNGCILHENRNNHCDDSMAVVGDPCDTEDEVACSMDHKSALVCRSGTYVKQVDCKRKGGCEVRDDRLFCGS